MIVESPCTGICRLENKICVGCKRTDKEIQQWFYADNKQKLEILEAIEKRRKQ